MIPVTTLFLCMTRLFEKKWFRVGACRTERLIGPGRILNNYKTTKSVSNRDITKFIPKLITKIHLFLSFKLASSFKWTLYWIWVLIRTWALIRNSFGQAIYNDWAVNWALGIYDTCCKIRVITYKDKLNGHCIIFLQRMFKEVLC